MTIAVDQDPPPKIVGAVVNAISILRYLAQLGEPVGVAVIARNSGVSVSTCFNILRTLTMERLVDFDAAEKTYRIGMGVLEFSVPLLGASHADLIRPELQRLSGEHKSLVCLWLITENERVVLIDRISPTRVVRVDMSYGARLPAAIGAVGRCYAAHMNFSPAELRQRFEKLEWQNPPDYATYVAETEQAGRDGYAFDFGQLFIGLEIAAALVTDTTGKARLGISGINIAGQLQRKEMERLALDLRDSADWISEALFGVARGARQNARRDATLAAERRP